MGNGLISHIMGEEIQLQRMGNKLESRRMGNELQSQRSWNELVWVESLNAEQCPDTPTAEDESDYVSEWYGDACYVQEQVSLKQHDAGLEHHVFIDQFLTTLNNHRSKLSEIISLEYGLLDKLVWRNVMTSEAAERIRAKTTQRSKIDQLVLELNGHPEQLALTKKRFLDALDASHHKHVSNFIQGDGNRSAEYGDDWPLILCEDKMTRMNNYRDKFIELVDTRNGLLTRMLSIECINYNELRRIEAEMENEEKNVALLVILRRGSLATYKAFIRALVYTKQHQIVSLLAPDMLVHMNMTPLSKQQQSRIQTNYDALVNIMDTTSELMALLFSVYCLTQRQKVYVESATTQTDRTKRLLDIMRRGSAEDFAKFVRFLNETGQHHVSDILRENGVVVPVAVGLSIDGASSLEEDKEKIMGHVTALLRGESNKLEEQSRKTTVNHLTELRNNSITILNVKKESNVVFYFCRSLRGLHYFYDLYVEEQLRGMMEDIFIFIFIASLNSLDVGGLRIATESPDYNNCVRKLRVLKELEDVPSPP